MAEKDLILRFGTEGMPHVIGDFTELRQQAHATSVIFTRMNAVAARTSTAISGVTAATGIVGSGRFESFTNSALIATNVVDGLARAFTSLKAATAGVVGLGTAVFGFGVQQGMKTIELHGEEAQARMDLRQANARMIAEIKKKLESSTLSPAENFGLGGRLLGAIAINNLQQQAQALRSLAMELLPVNELTKEQFEAQSNLLDAQVGSTKFTVDQTLAIQKEGETMEERNTRLGRYLDTFQKIIEERQTFINQGFSQNLITDAQSIESVTRTQKELLEVELKRKAIRDEQIAAGRSIREGQINKRSNEQEDAFKHDVPGQLLSSIIEAQEQIGTTAELIGRNFGTFVMGSIDSVANGIRGLLTLTMTWGDALRNIGVGIFNEIINSISRMVAEYIVAHVVMAGVLKAFHFLARLLGWETTGEQIAQETSKAPALAANAATASVGSYGASAVIGMALAVAAIAAIIAYAAGAFEQGGYTGNGGTRDIAGVVHGREYVFSAPAVDRLGLGTLEALHSGRATPGGMNIKAVFVWDQQEAADMMANSPENERVIIQTIGKNAYRFRS